MKQLLRIISFAGSLKSYYIRIAILTIVLAALGQLTPLFTKGAIDEITKLTGQQDPRVWLVAVFAAAIFLTGITQTFLNNINGYLGDIMSAKLQRFLSLRYYEHMMSLPQHYFDTELSGKVINRLSRSIGEISGFLQMMSNNFLEFLFSTVFTLVIVSFYSWPIALMLLALYPIFIWLTKRTSNKWQKYQETINTEKDIASGRFAESINQVRVVKSFVQQARELKFFESRMSKVVKTTRPQSKYWHSQDVIRTAAVHVIFFGIYLYLFIATAQGRYDIGTMVLLIQYAAMTRGPLFSISFLVDRTQRAISDSKDYFAALDETPEVELSQKVLAVSRGNIELQHVDFGYDTDKLVLKDISAVIKPDTKIALVGESGEGKTTLTNLLLRLYEPSHGAIIIDGQNIAEVSRASLRENIGVVFQDPALFSGTIAENIAYAQPDASEAAITKAAKAANAHEFISKFEKGYQTEIGERGLKLSGGQKQRIAIARAILKDAPILVLDEATSSLDSKSEQLVQQALEHLMKNRTTIIIAHRLSTIQSVDQILTLKNGRIDEIGSPKELAKSGGIYAQLLNYQTKHTDSAEKKLKDFGIKA